MAPRLGKRAIFAPVLMRAIQVGDLFVWEPVQWFSPIVSFRTTTNETVTQGMELAAQRNIAFIHRLRPGDLVETT